jgi:uncharacterized iron-regulated membrane protein
VKPSSPGRRKLSPGFRKAILALHRWVGLVTGSIFLIVSLTGALFVFEREIFALFHRDLLQVEPSGAPMHPASGMLASGEAAMGSGIHAGWIEGFGPDKSVQVHAYESDDSAKGIWYWNGMKTWKTAYVDPYSGKVLGVTDHRFEFFNVVRQIHQNLLLKYEYGHYIVGVTVLAFVGMLLSGLFLWLPRNRAAVKQRLKVAWGAGRRRLRFDLHVVFGIYVWIPVFIIALTGLTWSFQWWAGGINYLLSGKAGNPWAEDPAIESVPPAAPAAADASAGPSSILDMAFLEAKNRSRAGGSYSVSVPKDEKGVIEAEYQEPVKSGWRAYSELKFDRYSGKLLASDLFRDKDIRKKWGYSTYDIHVGSIFGWPTQILAFLTCLLCASLPVTGFLMWRGKRRHRLPSQVIG